MTTKFDMQTKPVSEVVEEDVAEMLADLDKLIAKPDGTVTVEETLAVFRGKHIA